MSRSLSTGPTARAHIRVLDVENRTRHLVVQVVNAGLLDPYELVLKATRSAASGGPRRTLRNGEAGATLSWRTCSAIGRTSRR